MVKNPILSTYQIKDILSYVKANAKVGEEYKFFDFFINSPKDGSYYFIALSPLANTEGYILSRDILYFAKKLDPRELTKIALSKVVVSQKRDKKAFIFYPLKYIRQNTIGYVNFYPPNWLESYFKLLFAFVCLMTISIYIFGLVLIYITANIVFKKQEENMKKVIKEIKNICFNQDKIKDDLYNEIVELVFYDPLTYTYNRKYFFYILKKEIERAKRFKYPLSIVYLDLDDFKKINDTYGHKVGDEVLKYFADLVSSNIRKVDIFARVGGEEFVILLPEMALEDAVKFANRLLNLIKGKIYKGIKLSASIGVTTLKEDDTPESFLERADKAMYLAKKSGKGQVKVL